MYLLKYYFKYDYDYNKYDDSKLNYTIVHGVQYLLLINYIIKNIGFYGWNSVVILRANRHTSFRWMGTRMKDVDIDTQTDRPDGWASRASSRKVNPWRAKRCAKVYSPSSSHAPISVRFIYIT